jgi:hypothetical protein
VLDVAGRAAWCEINLRRHRVSGRPKVESSIASTEQWIAWSTLGIVAGLPNAAAP